MELTLLIFGILMACIAALVVGWCTFTEVSEAWDIKRYGWQRGHRLHRLPHRAR